MQKGSIGFKPNYFWIIAGSVFLLAFLIESLNHKLLLNDFKVYYQASALYFNHGNPYSQAFGLSSGFYKYSPAWLYLFAPFSLLKFSVSKNLYYLLISVCGIAAYELSANLTTRYAENGFKRQNLFKFLFLLTGIVHLSRELHLGNINLILILLVTSTVYSILNQHFRTAGILIALTVFLKPYFVIVFVPVLIYRYWKVILPAIATGMLLLLLPITYSGWSRNLDLHREWLGAMTGHQENMFSEHTLSSIFTSYSGIKLPAYWTFIFIALVVLLYVLLRVVIYSKTRISGTFIADTFILLALLPNLVTTDSEHFLYSMPLIALILGKLALSPKWGQLMLFCILWFFYGANSNDLLGNPLSDLFDTYSTIGLANLGFIAFYGWIDRKPA